MVYTLASERKNLSEFASASNNLDFRFYYEILDKFTPVQLMALAVALCTLICTFLGLFMFCISLYGDRMFNRYTYRVFVLMLYFCENFPLQKYKRFMAHFVPTYWAEIALMETRTSGYYRMPSLTYMFAFLCIAIAGMSALICLRRSMWSLNGKTRTRKRGVGKMTKEKPVIEIDHVYKTFKDNTVLKDVTVSCEGGRIYGFVGHNGSGEDRAVKVHLRFLQVLPGGHPGERQTDGKGSGHALKRRDYY